MHTARKWILLGIVGAVLVLAANALAILLVIRQLKPDYTVNRMDEATGQPVADGFALYSGDGIGYAFQYPEACATGWTESDGAYLYCGEAGQTPYVLISRANQRGMNPERYFRACDKMMQASFENLQSTPIQEATVGEKTLYLVRYLCDDLVVDRYLELYDDFYMEYTAISDEAGSLNTELYYAITTLRVREGAYIGAYSEAVSLYQAGDLGLEIRIPDMLETKELTLGYFASSDDIVFLALWIEQDDSGKAIYNRQDFIDRAAETPDFVAGLLGAETASFSEGQEAMINGRSFYCYPMDLVSGGEAFTGELCLANAEETGCWVVCYAVREEYPMREQTLALLQECASGIIIK